MDCRAVFEQELTKTGRNGIEQLIDALAKTDFYECRCAGHDTYKGGTLNHSLWTLLAARKTLEKYPTRYPGVTDNSLIIVCLLHDIGDIRNSFRRYSGHGRKAALILKEIRDNFGLDITDEELGAIRFHRGHRITDDFDKGLSAYMNTPLIRLLKHCDHTVAGVMNEVLFGLEPSDSLGNKEHYTEKFVYNPNVKHWYLDTSAFPYDSYPTRHGHVDPKTLTHSTEAHSVFNINLYHISSYDLRVFKDASGKLGVFTVVSASMGMGDLFRSDRHGFGYKTVVVYYNKYNDHDHVKHFIVTENAKGLWSVVSLKYGDFSQQKPYNEFIERDLMASNCATEKDALEAFRQAHHGINLNNPIFYERTLVK